MAEPCSNPRVRKTIKNGVLECGVCEDLFAFHGEKVPRLLLCGHTLCHECLTKLPLQNRTVFCPFDRQKTKLGDSGVWGLKKNFALLELLERLKVSHAPLVNTSYEGEEEIKVKCDENEEHLASVYCTVCGTHLCNPCSEITHATKTLNKHKRVSLSEKPLERAVCPEHHARIIEFACAEDSCQNNPLMCVLCKDYGKHKGHKHHLVTTEAENVRSSTSNAIQHIKLFSDDVAKGAQKIDVVIQKIEELCKISLQNAGNGVVGGAVTKGIVGKASSVAAANIEGEALEQIAIRSGTKEVVRKVTKSMSSGLRKITEATGGMLGIVEAVAEERLDKSTENKPIGEHAKNGAISTGVAVGLHAGLALSTEYGKQTVRCVKNIRQDLADPKQLNKFIQKEIKLKNKSVEIHEPKYKPTFDGFECDENREENVEIPSFASLNLGDCSEHKSNGRIRLISEGAWVSKMIIRYMLMGNEEEREVMGNGGSITIPEEARNIEIQFQVLRFIGTWCDVKKYDRIKKSWCEPIAAHVFKYELPPIRTFTIAGSLYFEAVMHVRDGHWNDLVEMQ